MSVGFLKRLLTMVNLVAVVAIAGTAYGFVSHRAEMKKPWKPADFVVPARAIPGGSYRIENVAIPLGVFPEAVAAPEAGEPTKAEVKLEEEIDKLGFIKSAIVVYPPYTDTKPALTFEYKVEPIKDRGKVQAIQLGEALITQPHSDPERRAWGDRENVRFEFVSCKPDPDNKDWTLFEFDIDCDGKNVQSARWKGEVTKIDLPTAKRIVRTEKNTRVLRNPNAPKVETKPVDPKPGPGPKTGPVVEPIRPRPGEELRGPIFESESGTFATTDEGIRYLRENHSKILKDATTTPYVDPEGVTRGIQIRRIKSKSVANEFGIMENDVIVAVNNRPVKSKTQAVNVVKQELNKPNARYIEVKVLRLGATKILRFDSRDPATRRKATKGFRGRN